MLKRPGPCLFASVDRRLPWLAVGVALVLFGFRYAGPVWDADTGWHVATGRWIFEHLALPDSDPFGVYDKLVGAPAQVILKGYWLAQLAMYACVAGFGAGGLIGLRVLLLLACLLILIARGRALGADWRAIALVGALVGASLSIFTGDRPVLFSFLLAGAVFWLAERAPQRRPWWRGWSGMALLGCLWANLHGGWVLVLAVLGLHALASSIVTRLRTSRTDLFPLVGAAVAALAALVSPVGFLTIKAGVQIQLGQSAAGGVQQQAAEYIGSLFARSPHDPLLPLWIGAYFALTLIALPGLARERPERAISLAALALLSMIALRYHPFFLLIGGPWLAQGIAATGRWWAETKRQAPVRARLAAAALPIATLIVGASLAAAPAFTRPGRTFDPMSSFFPAIAPALLIASLHGRRVFSYFDYGGYLLWQAPGVRPYIDTRAFDPQRIVRYNHILWVTPLGRHWLETEGIDAVIVQEFSPASGKRYPLPAYLASTGHWRVVQRNQGRVLMLRD